MSDEDDITVTAMMMRLTLIYQVLRRASGALPIVIVLPEVDGETRIGQCVAAVARAYEITWEVPMPDEIKGHLRAAYLHWLSALDLIKVHMTDPIEYRKDAVMFTLETAESYIGDVDKWLRGEGDTKD